MIARMWSAVQRGGRLPDPRPKASAPAACLVRRRLDSRVSDEGVSLDSASAPSLFRIQIVITIN